MGIRHARRIGSRTEGLMKTLVYKRTHAGDPDANGCFGIEDCMGRVRGFDFDAVIGIGGVGRQPRSQKIDGKINWIGIGAKKKFTRKRRWPVVTFRHFALYEKKGKSIRDVAPILARRLLSRNARVVKTFTAREQREVRDILRMARSAPSSAPIRRLPDIPPKRKCGCGRSSC